MSFLTRVAVLIFLLFALRRCTRRRGLQQSWQQEAVTSRAVDACKVLAAAKEKAACRCGRAALPGYL